ncbi:hypothetical protein [Nocardioides ferulae]|uniref:hypothetical protein n=1 Tax=Nocardioides ferulae TaxID=2340821 RepID=UPI0013DE3DEF|nr:hypothetical protein [Nocardioides ferulae]
MTLTETRPETTLPDASHPESGLRPVTGIWPAISARWRLLPIGLLLGLGIGAAAAVLVPTTYDATATVRVGAGLVPVGEMNPGSDWAQDQAVLARTEMVLTAIGDRLGEEPEVVGDRLTVAQHGETSYLDFSYTADTGSRAERGADTAAAIYLQVAQADAERRWQDQVDLLDDLVAEASGSERAALRAQRRTLERTVVDPGRTVQSASGEAQRATVDPSAFPLAGALGGLLLAAAVAYLLEARSPRARPLDERQPGGLRLATLGRLDGTDEALVPVAGRLEQVRLPEGREKARLGVAVVGARRSGQPRDVVAVVRQSVRKLTRDRKVRTVAVDLSTTQGVAAARECDELLVVAIAGRSHRRRLERVRQRLEVLELQPLGVVVAPRKRPRSAW